MGKHLRIIMSMSRHFVTRRSTRSSPVVKKEPDTEFNDLSTFKSELELFDKELELELEDIKSRKIGPTRRKLKHVKLESEISTDIVETNAVIPPNFFPLYNKIKEMRNLIVTPVDLIGCVKIPVILKYLTLEYQKLGQIKTIAIDDLIKYQSEFAALQEKSGTNDRFYRFHLLVTLLFSSQTKDEANFEVMQGLHNYYLQKGFTNGLCIESIMASTFDEINNLIFKIGFHTRKTQYLIDIAKELNESYDNDIPTNLADLTKLKGIGNKMGHLILQGAFNTVDGISVDTHMVRLCNMFNWVKNEKNPDNIRKLLESMLENHKELWLEINPVLVGFGQSICTPAGRRCDVCLLSRINEKNDVVCPAVDKKLLLRVERGTYDTSERKIRGDLSKLIDYLNS